MLMVRCCQRIVGNTTVHQGCEKMMMMMMIIIIINIIIIIIIIIIIEPSVVKIPMVKSY